MDQPGWPVWCSNRFFFEKVNNQQQDQQPAAGSIPPPWVFLFCLYIDDVFDIMIRLLRIKFSKQYIHANGIGTYVFVNTERWNHPMTWIKAGEVIPPLTSFVPPEEDESIFGSPACSNEVAVDNRKRPLCITRQLQFKFQGKWFTQ